MPTYQSRLNTWVTTDSSTGTRDWDNPGNAEEFAGVGLGSNATVSGNKTAAYETDYLKGTGLVDIPSGTPATLTEIRVKAYSKVNNYTSPGPFVDTVDEKYIHLVKSGSALTAVNKAGAGVETVVGSGWSLMTWTFTQANLTTLGVVASDLSSADFGVGYSLIKSGGTDTIEPLVDQVFIEWDGTFTGGGAVTGVIHGAEVRYIPGIGLRPDLHGFRR